MSWVRSGGSAARLGATVRLAFDRAPNATAPGIPADFPDPQSLLTDDCIRPAE